MGKAEDKKRLAILKILSKSEPSRKINSANGRFKINQFTVRMRFKRIEPKCQGREK
jgi:hypothetical protein